MQPTLNIIEAMLHCPYKAWKLSGNNSSDILLNIPTVSVDKIAQAAFQLYQSRTYSQSESPKKSSISVKAEKLLADTERLLNKNETPPFYKISHCSECQFKNECLKSLKERDCISLLAGMTPKIRLKYHKKGITTITQLSHLFRPRRRNRVPQTSTYMWELKALAIREQKTFVVYLPGLIQQPTAIYIDFEGIPDENHYYLLGCLIVKEGTEENLSYWAENQEDEKIIFEKLFILLHQYPDAPIYHFGSYESKALKNVIKKYPDSFRSYWPFIEKRMVNLLSYFRTHVYPPTYGNGLKEIAGFLGYKWNEAEADGFLSIKWRKEWEEMHSGTCKEKLLLYNQDDCNALKMVCQWLSTLTGDAQENVQQIAEMKRHTPYKLQNNLELGEDFQVISKAAYFDYQRNKIYWRNGPKKQTPVSSAITLKPKQSKKGSIAWQPKKVNEVIIAPPLKKCPHCGHTKLYQMRTMTRSTLQTTLKFTTSGVRQHVIEHQTAASLCAKCRVRTSNKNLRMLHYGDDLFALVINYYVNYHISNEMISKLIQEYYGIWISQMYLVMHKNTWWSRNWVTVADYIREIVLNSPVIHIDETTIKLAKESGYVWVFATTHSVFYHYTPTHDSDFLQKVLKDYKGIVISDFFPGYETLHQVRQKCLIHLIRDLNDDLFKNPFDEEYKAMVSAFNKLLRKIIETIDKHGLQQKYLEKHETDISKYYSDFVDRNYKSELSTKYAKKLKRHWDQLWTFLHHENVPWNNNNAEAAIKAFAQHRRGVKGQMHVRGLNDYLQMLTVAQTCRYRNISFLSFLRKRRGIWENIAPQLLPGHLPFEQARMFIRQIGFENTMEWNEWKHKGNRPVFIPSAPNITYKGKGWIDWYDWLGSDFLPFQKARTFMRKLNLKNRTEYQLWLKSGKRPKNIPCNPEKTYKHTGWINMKDWLGIIKK